MHMPWRADMYLEFFFFFFSKKYIFFKKNKKKPKNGIHEPLLGPRKPMFAHAGHCEPQTDQIARWRRRAAAVHPRRHVQRRASHEPLGGPAAVVLRGNKHTHTSSSHTHHKMYSHVIHCQRYHRSQEQAIHTHSIAIIPNPATDSAQKQPLINQSTATNQSINQTPPYLPALVRSHEIFSPRTEPKVDQIHPLFAGPPSH
jgi:hypothetical protein